MAPAMKLVIKYEEGDDKDIHTLLKLTLPRKWKEGPTKRIKEEFVDQFNKKHGDKLKLDLDQVHLLNMAGNALHDEDVVVEVFNTGDHVRVKPGAPPKFVGHRAKEGDGQDNNKKPIRIAAAVPTPQPASIEKGDNVSSKAALDAAREQPNRAFDYSKWDRLDLSDDDADDCHPNIDKDSWKRLMAQKRADRRKQEEAKIDAYKSKIDKYRSKAKVIKEKIDGGDENPQLIVDLKDAEESLVKYQDKLDHFMSTRKLTADDLCDVSEDHTVVSKNASIKPAGVTLPIQQQQKQESASSTMKPDKPRDEGIEYDQYIKLYGDIVDKYAEIRNDEASEAFLFENPEILSEHAEGYLLLLTLDTCMQHLEQKEELGEKFTSKHEQQWQEKELGVARQHLLIQFVLTLSKSKNCDPRDMIKPFFRKTSKGSADRVEGFEDDLLAFVTRIRNRAVEKLKNGEISPLANRRNNENEQYELAGLGPGGLDPNEVLPTLPEQMQEAFVNQDTEMLKACLQSLTPKEAEYHMQRCIDSGLWVPGPNDHLITPDYEDEDDDDEAADEQQELD